MKLDDLRVLVSRPGHARAATGPHRGALPYAASGVESADGRAGHSDIEQSPESLDQVELSVVMPCLNEAQGVGVVVEKARRTLEREGIAAGEVIVADNGSEDGSPEIAAAAGAPTPPR